MARKVEVDWNLCVGSANCEYWAPDTFEVDDDEMRSVVIDPEGDSLDDLQRAERGCPTQAITVETDATTES